MKKLYYSWSNGNTRKTAERLQKATGTDIAEIKTVVPYTGSHQDVVDQGQREVESGFQPKIEPLPYSIYADFVLGWKETIGWRLEA